MKKTKTTRDPHESLALVRATPPEECTLEEQSLLAVGKMALQLEVLQQEGQQLKVRQNWKAWIPTVILMAVVWNIASLIPRHLIGYAIFLSAVIQVITMRAISYKELRQLKENDTQQKELAAHLRNM